MIVKRGTTSNKETLIMQMLKENEVTLIVKKTTVNNKHTKKTGKRNTT